MANTTNLNLVKPAGTDKALVSVINSNSDKIDAFAGTTNQAIANLIKKDTYSFESLEFSAGTIGTRGGQWQKSLLHTNVISITIAYIDNSTVANFSAFVLNNVLFLNAYRATSGAMTNNKVIVEACFI